MGKILKVCLSNQLPDILKRNQNYIYFLYDKLELYFGQNKLSEDFAIATKMPDEPIPGMIYILNNNGTVHRFIDYKDTIIATIENEDQIELLKKAGTIFYVNNNKRYIDSQKRTLTLPFNNGTYELSVAMKNDQIFDNNTILKYNEKNERFEIYGETDEEFIDYSKPFRGGETNSMKILADGPSLKAYVKLSALKDNMLKATSDGLYVFTKDKVGIDDFNKLSKEIVDYRKYAQDVIDKIQSDLSHLEYVASESIIREEIMDILSTKYATIEEALANYEDIYNSLSNIETEVLNYSYSEISSIRNELLKNFDESTKWKDLDNIDNFSQEVDYYSISEKYLYPELSEDEVRVILTAVTEYLYENGGI